MIRRRRDDEDDDQQGGGGAVGHQEEGDNKCDFCGILRDCVANTAHKVDPLTRYQHLEHDQPAMLRAIHEDAQRDIKSNRPPLTDFVRVAYDFPAPELPWNMSKTCRVNAYFCSRCVPRDDRLDVSDVCKRSASLYARYMKAINQLCAGPVDYGANRGPMFRSIKHAKMLSSTEEEMEVEPSDSMDCY